MAKGKSSKQRIAEFLKEEVGVGNRFTMQQLREVVPGVEQVGRRLRDLRAAGWVIQSVKDDSTLETSEYRFLRAAATISGQGRISNRVRREVFDRAGNRCQVCGGGAGEPYPDLPDLRARLQIGHHKPLETGGSNDRENLREYLESLIWPRDIGVVSLYSSRAYTQAEPGWYLLPRTWVWGALAFIFPRERAKEFVSDRRVLRHRWNTWNNGCANIDSVIGQWASRGQLKIYYPSPSLAQHVGEMSTIWKWTRASGHRRADCFAGDE